MNQFRGTEVIIHLFFLKDIKTKIGVNTKKLYVRKRFENKKCSQNIFHKGRMFTKEECSQWKNVHKGRMFTKEECSQRKNVHKGRMFTKEECSQRKNVHKGRMFTKEECSQMKNVHK